VALRDGQNPRRHRGREQRRLSGLGVALEDRVEILGEAHVEHFVGFVEDQHLQLPPAPASAQRMWSSARPGVATTMPGAAFEGSDLLRDGRAAVHGHDPNADALGVLVNRLRDLHRQLAGRDEHQPAGRPLGLGVAGEALQQGQREGGGLSGARRRLREKVPAGDQQRNGFALDRGRLLVSERGHCGGQLVDQAETGKAACCYVGCLMGHVTSIVVPGGGARNLADPGSSRLRVRLRTSGRTFAGILPGR
jgi:hypothetical protein